VARLTIAARWCIVLCNKGILHLGARGHQEAPVHQWRGAPRGEHRDKSWRREAGKIVANEQRPSCRERRCNRRGASIATQEPALPLVLERCRSS
jgi:hypothetical protein